jgi:glycosyltransferase involved in cell wall biosynthesis
MAESVSVLIGTYNYGRFLTQCLESVCGQTRPPDEVIVVDDGSTDETDQVLRRFPDVRYIRQNHEGKSVAFNRAVRESTGDIICHLDADDFWMPDKLELVCRELEQRPFLGGVIHETLHVGEDGQPIRLPYAARPFPPSTVLTCDGVEEIGFLYPLPNARGVMAGNPNTVCARRSALLDMFPLPVDMGLAVDAVFLAGAIRFGLLYLPNELAAYRHHGQNAWLGNPRATQHIINFQKFLLANEGYRRHISPRHLAMTRAKLYERKAFLASRTGDDVFGGFCASVALPFLLLRHGLLFNWKHLLLPLLCVLPVKKTEASSGAARPSPVPASRQQGLVR